MKIILISFLFIVTAFDGKGQQIAIKNIQLAEGKLLVGYDLLDSIEGKFYSVRLYASSDGFLNPLEKIEGDLGLEIKPGRDKTIAWSYQDELPETFEGKVAVEVRARIFIPFINVQSINQYKVYKRGRKYNVTWTGGTPQNVLNFDLFNGEKKIYTFPNIANVGHYSVEFPKHIKADKNYRFRISDSKNKEEVVFSDAFRIKRKIPLLLKSIPIVAIGGGVYFLSALAGEDDSIVKPPNPNKY